MTNLCPSPWRRPPSPPSSTTPTTLAPPPSDADAIARLDKFFENVESIHADLHQIDLSHLALHQSNQSLKSPTSTSSSLNLRSAMDAEVAAALKRAKLVKLKLESLDRSNASNRFVPGSLPGSSTERLRASVVAGLRKKLRDRMAAFADLRSIVMEEEGEEEVLAAAMEGRGAAEAAVEEMRERKGAVERMERSLVELQHVFMDMEVMVGDQGIRVDDIEKQLGKASSFVDQGVEQLYEARRQQINARKCVCIGGLVIVIVCLVFIFLFFFVLKK